MDEHWTAAAMQDDLPDVEAEFARAYVDTPRFVFSDTLESVPSGVELVRSRDAAAVVSRLKDEIEGPLALGGAGLAASLLDLIDEFQLVVLPVVVGAGKPFFPAGVSSHSVWSTNRCSIRGPCTSPRGGSRSLRRRYAPAPCESES